MSDPLSISSSVVGLAAITAKIASIAKQLYNSGKDAPTSIRRVGEEMDQLHLIFGQVQMLLEGHAEKIPSRSRLTMLPLHHLMTILSGCVLAYSSLDKTLSEVAGLVREGPLENTGEQNIATTMSAGFGARVRWAVWKEAEAGAILMELDRHKSSLHMVLTIIKCSMKEASPKLVSLHEQVAKILEKISESHNDVAVKLRGLISRHPDAYNGTSGVASSSSNPSSPSLHFNGIDRASTPPSLPIRSLWSLVPSWGEEVKNSSPYKRLWSYGVDWSSGSVFPEDRRSTTKGVTWPILSDMNLGGLTISGVSVLELPISLSDLYDPIPYQVPQSTRHKQSRRGVSWSSSGRLHRAIDRGNIFTFRTLLNLGADPEETGADGPLLVYAARAPIPEGVVFCRLLLDRGAQVDTRDSSGRTPLSHCAELTNLSVCKLLVDRGAAVDSTDSNGCTPLVWLVCTPLSHSSRQLDNCIGISELLLNRGAAIDSADSSRRTLLSHCAGFGNYNLCKLLLDRGASVDSTDSNDRTPLSYCAGLNGEVALCELLLSRGGKVDVDDVKGRTPLSYSAARAMVAMSRVLLRRGAMPDRPDLNGHTPLWYARGWGEESEVYELLRHAYMLAKLDS